MTFLCAPEATQHMLSPDTLAVYFLNAYQSLVIFQKTNNTNCNGYREKTKT